MINLKSMKRRNFLLSLLCVSLCLLFSCRGNNQTPAAKVSAGQIQLSFQQAADLQERFVWQAASAPLISAHRGGPVTGFPENCIATFEHTLEISPAILEMDVNISADTQLLLMHDRSLDRTTTGTGMVQEKSWDYISGLQLKDNDGNVTNHKVPTLVEVLDWGRGKCVMSLDVKRGVPFEKVVEAIAVTKTEGSVMIIVYNMEDAKRVYELNPRLLLSVSIRNEEELQRFEATGIPARNVVAFTGTRTKEKAFYDKLHQRGISCILGTLGNLDKSAEARGDQLYQEFRALGVDIFATDRPEAVARTFYGE